MSCQSSDTRRAFHSQFQRRREMNARRQIVVCCARMRDQGFKAVSCSAHPGVMKIDAEKSLNLDGVDIEKGQQVMDGHVLLQYARFRMDEEGDFGRVRRQQQVMSAVMSQMKN